MRFVRFPAGTVIAGRGRASLLGMLLLALAMPDAYAKGGTVRAVLHSGLRNLDPVTVISHITRNHAYMIYDVLIAQDEHFQPKPQMASWEVSPDGKVYTFTVRDGLKFHDGASVTAADAVASLQRWGAKDSGGQMVFAATESLTAKDSRTIVWTLKAPFPALLNVVSKMSTIPAFIMPQRIASTPIDKAITEHIGSGPFRFVAAEFQPGIKSVYERFADYVPRQEPPSWLAGGKVVKVDRVEWITMPDPQTAVNALAGDEIDYIEMPQTDLLPLLDGNRGVIVERRDAVGYELLLRMNFKYPPFDNLKMRQAVLKALNQREILKIMFGDEKYYRVCGAIFGCDSPLASTAGSESLTGSGDLAAARKLIAEAGYDGTPIIVVKATDVYDNATGVDAVTQLLRKVGLKIEVQEMDWQTRAIRVTSKKRPTEGGWNFFLSSFHILDINSPIYSSPLNARGEHGWLGWPDDPVLESMRAEFAAAPTQEVQKAVAARIQAHVLENVIYVPLGNWLNAQARSAKLTGMIPGPVTVFWNLEKAR